MAGTTYIYTYIYVYTYYIYIYIYICIHVYKCRMSARVSLQWVEETSHMRFREVRSRYLGNADSLCVCVCVCMLVDVCVLNY